MIEPERLYWRGHNLNFIADEPMIVSMIKYNRKKDRTLCSKEEANIVSSKTNVRGLHMPVLDLDFSHEYKPSTTPGHGHLYLNVPITWWRWALLMFALRQAGAIEKGFLRWSLRRGSAFVRPEGVIKTPEEQLRSEAPPVYGMFWRLRHKRDQGL